MPDIIQLLPDSVANQIAAGEVIQRPASVVKELLENAIDAGSTRINLIVKDAGRTLIQVIDNGCGMSESDARMCFERHATSKIKSADDLFQLHTKGFRGEALASIAAIAHVELKTRMTGEELGCHIIVEGTEIKSHEPAATSEGTSFSVKNLFYNVPARRNFLKSNQVEMRHILDEFFRVAMAHPEVEMTLHHNEQEMHNLPVGSLRQRIVGLMGKNYNQRLVPVEQATDIVGISGFVGKPEFARKTRGEQYFFVNNRFIKSTYLNHAVVSAFEELIQKGHHPSYFLFLDIEPTLIDVNIHPTKTELKFEDEKAIYAIMHSSVKQSLGMYNISPTLDFEQETSFNVPPVNAETEIKEPTISFDPNYNPFNTTNSTSSPSKSVSTPQRQANTFTELEQRNTNLDQLFKGNQDFDAEEGESYLSDEDEAALVVEYTDDAEQQVISSNWEEEEERSEKVLVQLHQRYIMSPIKSGYMMIDQHRAHERIVFEQLLQAMEKQEVMSQQLLFPQTVELNPSDFQLFQELGEEVTALGFDWSEFGQNTIVINGIPADAAEINPEELLEDLLEQVKHEAQDLKFERRERLAYALANKMAIKAGKTLEHQEMSDLIDRLFACEFPQFTPGGKPIVVTYSMDELDKRFEK